jgi:hypothetical protein
LAKNALEESAGAAAVKAAIFAWMYGKMSGADCDRNAGARNVFRRRKLNPVRARSPPERLAGSARMPAGFRKRLEMQFDDETGVIEMYREWAISL